MHIAVRSREGRIPEFMQYLKSRIADGLNRLLGREGHLWSRRYKAAPIEDEASEIAMARYIWSHGVKEGLVDRSEHWPGEASVKERLTGDRPTYKAFDRTAWFWAQRKSHDPVDTEDFERDVQVELSDWPFLAALGSDEARRARVAELVEEERLKAVEARGGKPSLGVPGVLGQSSWALPGDPVRRTPNPLCHAASKEARHAYRELYYAFVSAYHAASSAFRRGFYAVVFPPYALKPPLPAGWRPIAGLPPLLSPT